MAKFKFVDTGLTGMYVIEPTVFGDDRGFFMETFNKAEFQQAGLDLEFVQDNHSHSQKGTLRALHFQRQHPQGKLVRVIRGSVWDVGVDLRKGSPTYLRWFGAELSGANKRMLYVPRGFAHGYLALEDDTDFTYKCTELYYPEDEGGVIWNDPALNIAWPLDKVDGNVILSERDKAWPKLSEQDLAFEFSMYKL